MKHLLLSLLVLTLMTSAAQQTNYHFSHTDSTLATSNIIWRVWTDVPNWKKWDKGLKEADIYGNFAVGTRGTLVPDKGPQSKFIISQMEEGRFYTFKTKIPFGWLIINRALEVRNERTYFTHDVEFTGILKKVLGRKLGKKYKNMLPEVLSEIRKIAENK